MSKFFFADGRIEEHPADDNQPHWELHKPDYQPRAWTADIQPSDICTVGVFTFERQPDGTWWQCAPEYFGPAAALSRLADEVEKQKALVRKASIALRKSVYSEVDPFHGSEVLCELEEQGVDWWRDD